MPPTTRRQNEVSFHTLAFKLLGIDYLPLPRTNWHLREGQDGYDDPYLTDEDYQTLCNIVCERVRGTTVQAWRDSTLGERIALMTAAIENGARYQIGPARNSGHLIAVAEYILAELGALYRLAYDYCAALDRGDDHERRVQQLAACEQAIGEWRKKTQQLPSMLQELRTVRVVRSSAVIIGDQSRTNAVAWLVALGERACEWISCNDQYLEQLDIRARWLVEELGVDRERLFAEIGIELEKLLDDSTIKERLYIDDIDSFVRVQTVPPSAVAPFLREGNIHISEDHVKRALEAILYVPFHRNDRPDELNDIYTANAIVQGQRRSTAFMLKGPGIRKKEMTIADCGKNGDQLVRLFESPADLFIVQFVGRIADMLIKDVEGKIAALRKRGKTAQFVIVDGQDTARLLYAYGELPTANP
jgi:hypothetical protein